MTFGSGSNGCLGHGNFTDVSQVCCEGAGHAASPGLEDGSCFIRHVRQLIPAPGVCIPGVLWHLTPLPLLSLSLRVLKGQTCLSLSLSPPTQ